jgi:hypothetical protein
MAIKYISVFFLLISYQLSVGQMHNADSTGNTLAAAHAAATFQQAVHFQKDIYTGAEHIGYSPLSEGIAYFLTKEWTSGAVLYDGILYGNESLMYDQVKDKLVLKRFDGFPVELRSDKVIYFTLAGHTFVYINRNHPSGLKEGFYDRLAVGSLTILVRRIKILEEQVDEMQLRQRFVQTTVYYALKGNTYNIIKNKASLLSIVGGRKKEILQHLRQQGIKFKSNRELAIIAAAGYYNQTQP